MIKVDPVLVKFNASEHFISIRTVTRQRKSPYSFDLPRERFTDLEADGYILVKDGYSFAEFRLINAGSQVKIDFSWLSRYNEILKGFVQTVILDYDELAQWIWDSSEENGVTRWSMLSVDRTRQKPRLDFSNEGARRTIREILSVPVLRHKLTRAVRDNFQWPSTGDHVVCFYADYDRYSFFFREYQDGQEGICGGLILHHGNGLEKAKYNVHT